MSIMNLRYENTEHFERLQGDDRFQRNPMNDLKQGIDLIFELKSKLETFHPIATETLIRMISQ